MPFDKLKASSKTEGLRVDTKQRFLPRFENRGLARLNVSSRILKQVQEYKKEPYLTVLLTSVQHLIVAPKDLTKRSLA
jgi:hypothetical protein